MGFIFPVKDRAHAHGGVVRRRVADAADSERRGARDVPCSRSARFKAATASAKVDVLLQNHMLMDPIQPKLDALASAGRGEPNPFVVGAAEYQKFLDVMEGCTRVNLARRKG